VYLDNEPVTFEDGTTTLDFNTVEIGTRKILTVTNVKTSLANTARNKISDNEEKLIFIVDPDNIDRDLEDELATVVGGDHDNDADTDEVDDNRAVATDPATGGAADTARKRSPPPRRSRKRSRKKRRRR